MMWVAGFLALNTAIFALLYFRSLLRRGPTDYATGIMRCDEPSFVISEDNVDQTWGR